MYSLDNELAYRQFPAKIKRVGAMDCRIGIQAYRRNLIVVTRNIEDFEAVGIKCEDWSQA